MASVKVSLRSLLVFIPTNKRIKQSIKIDSPEKLLQEVHQKINRTQCRRVAKSKAILLA